MATQMTFERKELKFLIPGAVSGKLQALMEHYMIPDSYGRSTIFSLYYDTPEKRLIKKSLEKPVYKEKLRIRSYGKADKSSQVYVELKKKYQGIVYKRRVPVTQLEAEHWMNGATPAQETQIIKEITYFKAMYYPLVPSVLISCDREAYFGQEDDTFRMTFDDNILYRAYDLSLCKSAYGKQLLPPATQLLEVKCAYGLPLWLSEFLCRNKIFGTNFSKYGNAYLDLIQGKENGGVLSA